MITLRGVITPAMVGVMTPGRKIKVRMTVTVEVDAAEWAETYGCELDEVRGDVKSYFTNQIVASTASEEADYTVRVA